MKNINWNDVPEQKEFRKLEAGGYVCKVIDVEDNPDKEYLKVTFDIDDGEFLGYFADSAAKFGNWPRAGIMYRSYKDSAIGMFKSFVSALTNSNRGFEWNERVNANPALCKGKLFGVILREEEYYWNGEKKVRLGVARLTDVNTIDSGNFSVPGRKAAKDEAKPTAVEPLDDDAELPF